MAEGAYGHLKLTVAAGGTGEARPDVGKQWSIVSIEANAKVEIRRTDGTDEDPVDSQDTEPSRFPYPGLVVTRDCYLKLKNNSASEKRIWVLYIDTTPPA